MPLIEIYGTPFGSSFRPHWMLAEAGLAYETKKLDMKGGEHKQSPYLEINPAGQVPAMRYDDFNLSESAAIVHFLAEKHKPELLGATPEERATALRWE
jgi:glutathione S-transferase